MAGAQKPESAADADDAVFDGAIPPLINFMKPITMPNKPQSKNIQTRAVKVIFISNDASINTKKVTRNTTNVPPMYSLFFIIQMKTFRLGSWIFTETSHIFLNPREHSKAYNF